MPREEIDGTINGINVKVIIKSRQWFAKPNNHNPSGYCPNCPHFHDNHGILEIHEDSPDGRYFRKMYPEIICSGSYASGSTWVKNSGKELALLPMVISGNGFRITATPSGSILELSADSYCAMAVGRFGDWILKPPRAAGSTS